MPRINKTRYAILGLLSHLPMSGYDIKKTIEKSTGYFWSESNGQLYPILKQLIKEKLVTCEIDEKSGKRQRKVYTITPTGLTALREWLVRATELTPRRDELLLKLFFGKLLPPDILIEHLSNEHRRLLESQQIADAIEQELTTKYSTHEDYPYWLITLQAGQSIINARRSWCEEAIKNLQKLHSKE